MIYQENTGSKFLQISTNLKYKTLEWKTVY